MGRRVIFYIAFSEYSAIIYLSFWANLERGIIMEDQPKKKKPYPGKPQIFFESFTMSTNIAADCEVRGNFSQGMCGAYVESIRSDVFNKGISGCGIGVPPAQGYYRVPSGQLLCYSSMSDNYNVFNS